MIRPTRRSTLFPSTTLFRSDESDSKATMFPSPDNPGGAVGAAANPDASPPAAGTLTRVMLVGPEAPPAWERKMSAEPLKRSEEHTPELQSQSNLGCRLLLGK